MNRRSLVPGAKKELAKLKNEFAKEVGMELNEQYEGNINSRSNGHIDESIGSSMTKK